MRQIREENRMNTLHQIDEVLDSLNMHIEEKMHLNQNQITTKDNFHEMKHFIRKPGNSIRNLMDMVDKVVDEFQS